MQFTLDAKSLQGPVFVREKERDYLVRSEPRRDRPSGSQLPNNGGDKPPKRRRRRRRKLNVPYAIITFLFLLLIYPLGLIMLWLRAIPWKWTTKMGVTIVCAILSVSLTMFALWVPVQDENLQMWQGRGRSTLAGLGTEAAEIWRRADVRPERLLSNVQDIAGHSIIIAQHAISKGVPPLIERKDVNGETVGTFLGDIGEAIKGGTRSLMYRTNLLKTPDPIPVPDTTAIPGETPTSAPDETLAPDQTQDPDVVSTPEPSTIPDPSPEGLVAWHAEGDTNYHFMEDCEKIVGTVAPMDLISAIAANLMPCLDCASLQAASYIPSAQTATPGPLRITPPPTIEPANAPAPIITTPKPSVSPDPSMVTPKPTPTPTPTPKPTPTPTPVPLPAIKRAAETTVYYHSGSKYYHVKSTCGSMHDAAGHTAQQAADDKKKPCPYCKPQELSALLTEEDLVWVDENDVFHITDECTALMGNLRTKPLDQAMLEDGDAGCEVCGAALYVEAAKDNLSEPLIPAAPGTST